MEAAMQWGIALILQIQAHRTPMLDDFFRQITTLGSTAHMFIVPFLIWSLSYRFGSRLLITLLLSTFVNFALKDLWSQPRPFDLDSRIGPDREIGYGIPSGHAQHTMVEWGLIANWIANPWFTALAVILIVLIGLSRIYLGVHFPTDVLAGWALAGLVLTPPTRQTPECRLQRGKPDGAPGAGNIRNKINFYARHVVSHPLLTRIVHIPINSS